ncbi:DUF5753 domain-containing protein [Streptomyces sp. NPDC090022]|uniref:DUF5753 domain-containing protein n=1 Tax=Streptomyces sp. NPDC090022 TaxID=3365920 RepID=UPI003813EFF5
MNRGTREGQGNRASTVLGRRLGGRLLQLRDAAGRTQAQASQVLSATSTKVVKMERGWVPMRDPDIVALCTFYGLHDRAAVAPLLELAALDRERRKAKGWWQQAPAAGASAEYIALEDVATRVRIWQLARVPGLLQTAAYARALTRGDGAGQGAEPEPDDVERRVAVRLKRQERLRAQDPLQLHAVLWEGALRQEIGGREVMAAQLDHLARTARLPNVHLRILPFRAGGHPCAGGPFSIISFARPAALDVVHAGTAAATAWVEHEDDRARCARLFERAARLSATPAESLDLIEGLAKDLVP